LFSKIKSSLLVQTKFLFLISIAFIIFLWGFFYYSQLHQEQEHNTARYFNVAATIQPLLIKKEKILNEDLTLLGMQLIKKPKTKEFTQVFTKGNLKKGFTLLKYKEKRVLHLHNIIGEVYLEDIHKNENIIVIHIVFVIILFSQIFLYLKLKNSLNPLSTLSDKLKNFEKGDRTPLNIESNYEEIKQIIISYNQSVAKIGYMLETREMFNKIFMHEMKMPLAKGMFYLKQEPSIETHKKLQNILNGINDELDEFSQIESLIAYKNDIDKTEHKFLDILQLAIQRADIKDEDISIQNTQNCVLKGDKEFWTLCIKNLIDNAIKYSDDKKLIIDAKDGISFINLGDSLPVDISKNITKWKISKNKRHKSSTGYGFGLFIIKSIVTLHSYELLYNYDKNKRQVKLQIVPYK